MTGPVRPPLSRAVTVSTQPSSSGLETLASRVASDLAHIETPLREWVPERRADGDKPMPDVVIVGAGLSGLSIAFGLKRQGVSRVKVIDAALPGAEGPWVTSARMRTLRSPKTLTGPDLGVPSLTYRAWHEASYGTESWQKLDLINRMDWMAYLIWFRRIVGLDVQNNVRLLEISDGGGHLLLGVETDGERKTIACRKIVLATGLEGAGGLHVPDHISTALPRDRWTHSGELLDVAALKGKDIGIIGAAASSFDWAVAALEEGAKSATLLARAEEFPRTEILDWSNFPGFLNHFADLDDQQRYRFARRLLAFRTPPTQEMFNRANALPNFQLVMGAPVERVAMQGDRISIGTSAQGDFVFDHLLLGTGYKVDLSRRPELANVIGNIALWRDRFVPEAGEEDGSLLSYPYLGPAFEFTEKQPGKTPFLRDIHIFNNGAVPSLGPVCNGITGLKSGVPRIVAGLSRGLFIEDAELHYRALDGYDKRHFNPEAGLAASASRARDP